MGVGDHGIGTEILTMRNMKKENDKGAKYEATFEQILFLRPSRCHHCPFFWTGGPRTSITASGSRVLSRGQHNEPIPMGHSRNNRNKSAPVSVSSDSFPWVYCFLPPSSRADERSERSNGHVYKVLITLKSWFS